MAQPIFSPKTPTWLLEKLSTIADGEIVMMPLMHRNCSMRLLLVPIYLVVAVISPWSVVAATPDEPAEIDARQRHGDLRRQTAFRRHSYLYSYGLYAGTGARGYSDKDGKYELTATTAARVRRWEHTVSCCQMVTPTAPTSPCGRRRAPSDSGVREFCPPSTAIGNRPCLRRPSATAPTALTFH